MNKAKTKLHIALDGLSKLTAIGLLQKICDLIHSVKIHDLLDRHGPEIIQDLKAAGAETIWVDYKLHDTRDTVEYRVRALAENGAKIITVHASGGVSMMQAAVAGARFKNGDTRSEIYAITVLTSLDDEEIGRIYGKDRTREEIVHEFALMAKEAGVTTVVCSAQEVEMLSKSPKLAGMRFAVPGTRSLGADLGKQKRSATPTQAVSDGADELVIGSQVTKASDQVAALTAVMGEVG